VTRWRPSSGARAAESRAALLRRIRDHFERIGMLEVDTPALSPYAVSDTNIESFAIPESEISGGPLFLQTSPEFCMKRLLADGYPDIFSICRVFRDGEAGRRHQPEFTMVEWYRRELGLPGIIEDTLGLIAAALGDRAPAAPTVTIDYRDVMFRELELDA
jgi:lysyl-tRNA synthetase class 2